MDGRKIIVTAGQVPDRICHTIANEKGSKRKCKLDFAIKRGGGEGSIINGESHEKFPLLSEPFPYEMRTSSDVINENFPQTVADILRNSELPGPLEALERYKILS